MPYIEPAERERLDSIVNDLAFRVALPQDLSYILFKFFLNAIEPKYRNYCAWIGAINLTVMEINRRIIAPYENRKIRENGDVS